MAWTTPSTRATGDLITAAIWNADIVNNLAYLKDGVFRRASGGDVEFAFGSAAASVGFVGGARLNWTIAHGMGLSPSWAMVGNTWIGSGDTSTGQTEVVTTAVTSVDSTNLNLRSYLTGGATAAVGPGPTFWMAV